MPDRRQSTIAVLTKAIAAHARWKQHLREFIRENGPPVDPAAAARADTCDLGRWLETYLPTTIEFDRFQRVARLHASFHTEAARVARFVEARDFHEAEASLALNSPFTKVSAELTFELMSWKDELT